MCNETKVEEAQQTLKWKTSDWQDKSRLHSRFPKAKIDFATFQHLSGPMTAS